MELQTVQTDQFYALQLGVDVLQWFWHFYFDLNHIFVF